MPESPVFKFLDETKYCNSLDELSKLVQKTVSNLGFSKWGYETQPVNVFEQSPPVFIHTYPDEWVQHYMQQEYYNVDQVMTIGKGLNTPFQWSDLLKGKDLTKDLKRFNSEASEFGIHDGMGIPIPLANGSKSVFVMTGNDSTSEITKIIHEHDKDLVAIACVYHSMARDFLLADSFSKNKEVLTSRERECVLWTMNGLSEKQIADKLNLTTRTVSFHITNIKRKLNVTNKYHMVVEAIMNGYIQP